MIRKMNRLLWLVFVVALSVSLALGQDLNCPELLTQALEALNENCPETGRNEACYGYNRVEASFVQDVDEDFFTEPADVSPVADIETIRTAPLNLSESTWGVAVMNLQANLPNTLPGQSVTFVLMGDVEVENAVAPEDTFEGNNGIEVIVSAASANIRSGAGDNFNVIGGVAQGDTLIADALSPDSLWLRVIFDERPAWIRLGEVANNEAVTALPQLSSELRTPMQAFYLRTGIGQPECNEFPESNLLVQGPEDIEIELSVNGANIRLGSSGALRIVMRNGEPFLDVVVFDGVFEVDGVSIQAGEHSLLCLGNEESRGLDGESNDLTVTCDPTTPEKINPADFNTAWCSLENLPEDLLHYALSACYQSHSIANGENLFRISQFYCVSLDELVALNGITNPDSIFVGQQIFVPLNACAGEGSTRPPRGTGTGTTTTTTTTSNNDSEIDSVDCTTFSIPPQEVIATNFTLSWNGANGASEYELAIFDTGGFQISSLRTTSTSIIVNGGENFPPSGYVDIRAYRDGAYACYRRLNFVRGANPNPEIPATFGASIVSCGTDAGNYKAVVAWNNATAVPVTISYTDSLGTSGSTSSTASSGQVTIMTSYFVYTFSSINVSDGNSTISLGGC